MAEWTKACSRERDMLRKSGVKGRRLEWGALCEMGMKCEVIVFRYQLSVGA